MNILKALFFIFIGLVALGFLCMISVIYVLGFRTLMTMFG